MEEVVNFYKNSVPSIVVRLNNIYGYTKLKRPDLVPTIMQELFKKKTISVWNSKPVRDFIFAEDAAEAVVKLLNSNYQGVVNVGSCKSHSVKELIKIISSVSAKTIKSKNIPVKGPYKFFTNINLLKKITKWKTKHSFKEGLTKTYEITKKFS